MVECNCFMADDDEMLCAWCIAFVRCARLVLVVVARGGFKPENKEVYHYFRHDVHY